MRYVVFGTRPWHESTEHQGAPWQTAFSSRNHGGVRSIHPRDVYMLTQLLNHVSKEQCSRGEYPKKWGPGRRKFIDGGLFGALHVAGAWTGAGPGVQRKNTPRWAIDRGGAGNSGGGRRFRGPGGPVTNTTNASRPVFASRVVQQPLLASRRYLSHALHIPGH